MTALATSPPLRAGVVCGCPSSLLCSMCFDRAVATLAGVGLNRGHYWSLRIARARPALLARPWPETHRARTLAARQALDVSQDKRVVSIIGSFIFDGARHTWGELRSSTAERRAQMIAG